MSWFMDPDNHLDILETAKAEEALQTLIHYGDDDQKQVFISELLAKLSDDEQQWLQERFDQDNGDPQIPEFERRNLGPVWPERVRCWLRLAIYNSPHNIINALGEDEKTVVGTSHIETASYLTEEPHITVPVKVWRGILPKYQAPFTRLGMISKHVCILIGVRAGSHTNLPWDIDHVQLVYATVSDLCLPSNTNIHEPPIRKSNLLLSGWTIWDCAKNKLPIFHRDEKEISGLNEVILLKHIIRGLDREAQDFEEKFQERVENCMWELIGGRWYVAENGPERVYQHIKISYAADDKVYYHCPELGCFIAMDSKFRLEKHTDLHHRPWRCTNSDCHASFQQPNEWKSHEYHSHQQPELWLCLEACDRIDGRPKATAHICHQLFATAEIYGEHLKKEHNITDDERIKKKQHEQRVGKGSFEQGWCGFCNAVVAWGGQDGRFDHIVIHKADFHNWGSYRNIDGTYKSRRPRFYLAFK